MTAQRKFTSDPVNSTFRWVFHFTPGMGNVRTMDGYSKGVGPEHTNPHQLLINKLHNPILPKFIKCDKIEVFKNNFGLPKAQHEMVLELYPDSFLLHGQFQADPFLKKFLTAFYTEFLTTGRIAPPAPAKEQVTQAVLKDELSHTIRFKTYEELAQFVRSKGNKYSVGFMRAWYFKHLEIQSDLKVTAAKYSFQTGSLELSHV